MIVKIIKQSLRELKSCIHQTVILRQKLFMEKQKQYYLPKIACILMVTLTIYKYVMIIMMLLLIFHLLHFILIANILIINGI